MTNSFPWEIVENQLAAFSWSEQLAQHPAEWDHRCLCYKTDKCNICYGS